MKKLTICVLLSGCATTIPNAHSLSVSDGVITPAANGHLMTNSPEMRATIPATSGESGTLYFNYLGTPGSRIARLQSGEIRHQIGLKLRAQDSCNLVYVMWNLDLQKIVVSVKYNPDQHTSRECLDHGYHFDREFPPQATALPPTVQSDEFHVLQATISAETLTVKTDGTVAWQGKLPAIASTLKGPAGLRSDNVQFTFDYGLE